jgi:hypothetical protein
MNTSTLVFLLQIAAVLHLGLLWAGATMPRAVGLSAHLAALPSFHRRLFLVYFAFLALILASFGLLTFLFAGPMAAGDPVARGLCVVMAVFWIARLVVAALVLDVRPYLDGFFLRLGYIGTNVVFIYFTALYTWVAWKGGAL